MASRQWERVLRLKANGLCIRCSKPSKNTRCGDCAWIYYQKDKRKRELKKEGYTRTPNTNGIRWVRFVYQ